MSHSNSSDSLNDSDAIARLMACLPIRGPSCEEGAMAQWVIDQLIQAGVPSDCLSFDSAHQRTRTPGQVGNLVLRLPGTVAGPTRMLSAHLDTVPICLGSEPIIDGDYIRSAKPGTGVGADNRSGVAVLVSTVIELIRRRLPHPPLVCCWFVQEEIGLEGSRHANRESFADVAWGCNFDGSSPEKLTIGATGGERMDLTVLGRASHAGVAPQNGISAIVIAAKAIASLESRGWLGRIEKTDGSGTANVGVIQGGDATNVITPEVHLRAEARSHSRDFRQHIADELERSFRLAAESTQNEGGEKGSITVARRVDYESFKLPVDSPAVVACQAALRAVGREPIIQISNGGLDANWLYQHGVGAVTMGCGQRDPHTATERCFIPDYLAACRAALWIASGMDAIERRS